MKIKISASCAGPNFSFRAGEAVDADAAIAKDLIRAGYAEVVKEVKLHDKGDSPPGGGAGKPG